MPKPKKKPARPSIGSPSKPAGPLLHAIRDRFSHRRTQEGFALIDEALRRFPDHPDLLLLAAECEAAYGDLPKAAVRVRRAIEREPDLPEPLLLGSSVYGSCGYFSHAMRCARRLLEREPAHPDAVTLNALVATGDALLQTMAARLGRTMEAIEEAEFWHEEGMIHAASEDYDEALGGFRRYAELLPESDAALVAYADALTFAGRIGEAEDAARRAREIDPDDILAAWTLMRCARIRGDATAMSNAFAAIRGADPEEYPRERAALARAHGLMEDHEAAYAVARPLAEQESRLDAADLVVLGAAAANTGRSQEAIGYYRMLDARKMPFYSNCLEAIELGMPGPEIAGSFPYIEIPDLIRIPDFVAFAEAVRGASEAGRKSLHVRLKPIFDRCPQLVWIGEKILWEKDAQMGITVLLSLPDERAHRIVTDLPTDPNVPWRVRLDAADAWMAWDEFPEEGTLTLLQGDHPHLLTRIELDGLIAARDDPPAIPSGIREALRSKSRNPKRAEEIVRDLLDRYPYHVKLLTTLAEILDGDAEATESLFRHAAEAAPESSAVQIAHAIGLTARGKLEEAEAALGRVETSRLMQPNDLKAYLYAKFLVHAVHGRSEEAISALKDLVREDPEYATARELLKSAAAARRKGANPFSGGVGPY